jgi:medium-chain acyl-[acyl-carrier-protein] hydrolase
MSSSDFYEIVWPRIHLPQTPKFRLFCFPYAGGGPQIFSAWAKVVPDGVEVRGFLPPGRGTRFNEPLIKSIPELAACAIAASEPYRGLSFAFWGHSMGALLALECARQLYVSGKQGPRHLLLSGMSPPGSEIAVLRHKLDEQSFIEYLRELNGTGGSIFEEEELLEILIPILRADVMACETYSFQGKDILDIPVTVLAGIDDSHVDVDGLQGWQRYSSRPISIHSFPGDHFFIHSAAESVGELISSILSLEIKRDPPVEHSIMAQTINLEISD